MGVSLEMLRRFGKVGGGGFDGILGFSQGAAMAGIVCKLRKEFVEFKELKFAILVSGFVARSERTLWIWDGGSGKEGKIDLPVLNVYGRKDQVVDIKESRRLGRMFREDQFWCLVHEGGHVVPGGKKDRKFIRDFVESFRDDSHNTQNGKRDFVMPVSRL